MPGTSFIICEKPVVGHLSAYAVKERTAIGQGFLWFCKATPAAKPAARQGQGARRRVEDIFISW